MIYPCHTLLKNGSPSDCHCVGCKHQVEKGTTSMVLRKTEPPRDSVTPNLRKLKLIDLDISSEFADKLLPLRSTTITRQRREVSTSISTARSRSLPIPTSMDEQRQRHREQQDIAEAESFYANATWRMYRRITKHRIDHPLPDCYFNNNGELQKDDVDQNTAYNDDPVAATVATSDQSVDSATTDSTSRCERIVRHEIDDDDIAPFHRSQCIKDTEDDNDDEHCMMFELDLS